VWKCFLNERLRLIVIKPPYRPSHYKIVFIIKMLVGVNDRVGGVVAGRLVGARGWALSYGGGACGVRSVRDVEAG